MTLQSDLPVGDPNPTLTAALARSEGDLGHVLSWDPPFGISTVERWSCSGCGRAVIRYGSSIYGSALFVLCDVEAMS